MKTIRLFLFLILVSVLFIWGCSSKTENPVENSLNPETKILIIYNVDLIKTDDAKVYMKPLDGYHYEYLEKYSIGDQDKPVSDMKLGTRLYNVSKVVIEVVGEKSNYLFYEPGSDSPGNNRSAG